jgi:large subunit ribosomal protein L25
VDKVVLKAELRTGRGKGPARRIRAAGKIPAIFYGSKSDSIALAVDSLTLKKTIEAGGQNVVFDLNIKDAKKDITKSALLKERQVNPMDGTILHVDFIEVFEDVEVEVTIPLDFVGKPAGVDQGGIIEFAARSITVRCLPKDIQESIQVDVSSLEINQSIHVKDLELPKGLLLLDSEELAVASVVLPKRAAEVVAEEEIGEEAVEGEAPAGEQPAAGEEVKAEDSEG